MKKLKEVPNLDQIDAFVFDFDGVLTNNLVYLDSNGKETVACSRADGLAFEISQGEWEEVLRSWTWRICQPPARAADVANFNLFPLNMMQGKSDRQYQAYHANNPIQV